MERESRRRFAPSAFPAGGVDRLFVFAAPVTEVGNLVRIGRRRSASMLPETKRRGTSIARRLTTPRWMTSLLILLMPFAMIFVAQGQTPSVPAATDPGVRGG